MEIPPQKLLFQWLHSSAAPCKENDTGEALMAAIQRLEPLLTKQAVDAYPSHTLDVAIQCIVVLPAETSAVVAEVQKLRYQKLRYFLANQVQLDMVPPMMQTSNEPPLASCPMLTCLYEVDAHSMHSAAPRIGLESASRSRQNTSFDVVGTDPRTDGQQELNEAPPATLPLGVPTLLPRSDVRPKRDIDQPATTLTTLTTTPPDLPCSMVSKESDQPASFEPSDSEFPSGLRPTLVHFDTYYHSSASPGKANDTNETFLAAIQTLQPLLTKQAVSAYPSHILDLAIQCIAALPVDTTAVVAKVLKLRYFLANQV
ncbi:hypothetical protein SDRG_13382 [Saprolegnia diclina VS20]|uniref:Uncharacterized protein n=1 Tax=Saprolegnia diclina (strain VS20) TaxID=1156394 RepID=T0RGM1_SAPDV|nr:hypothetical protein SDRG_13382 [Saprolegnia diclina VS20]EQC28872.1 hypothetical protein SDRG_13382 [Saprolegnia diclina VS20]|eukprot:XP_008617689.1 hypothetical protein SDRG_13382 [Saprolegnia diclina VS20]